VESPLPADLAPLLSASGSGATPEGTPLRPLGAGGRVAIVTYPRSIPGRLVAGLQGEIEVVVRNGSDEAWPSLDPRTEHLVMLGYEWRDEGGKLLISRPAAARLPLDLHPGEAVRAAMTVVAPEGFACRTLRVGVTQDGEWLDGGCEVSFDVLPRRP